MKRCSYRRFAVVFTGVEHDECGDETAPSRAAIYNGIVLLCVHLNLQPNRIKALFIQQRYPCFDAFSLDTHHQNAEDACVECAQIVSSLVMLLMDTIRLLRGACSTLCSCVCSTLCSCVCSTL